MLVIKCRFLSINPTHLPTRTEKHFKRSIIIFENTNKMCTTVVPLKTFVTKICLTHKRAIVPATATATATIRNAIAVAIKNIMPICAA